MEHRQSNNCKFKLSSLEEPMKDDMSLDEHTLL